MSFILDALKKSEAERNRKAGPVLMDMRMARPRRRLPAWVWIIAIVLLANLALLAYALLRDSAVTPPAVATAPTTTATTAAPVVVSPPVAANDAAAAPTLPPPTLPPASSATTSAATGGVIRQSNDVVLPTGPGAAYESQPAVAANPEDSALPSDEDLRQSGVSVPTLRLSLHVYDNAPANRFVLLNSSRLFEGQETADGVRVERIVPTGVILSWRGRRFQMQPGN